jgi:cytochrome b561
MTQDIFVEDWQRSKPQSKAGRFDQISIALHWLTLALVAAQFATAWLLDLVGELQQLLIVHRSIGILTWIVVAVRLIWRHAFAHLPPFPASMPKLQQRLAKLNEYGLYGLLLVQPLTGRQHVAAWPALRVIRLAGARMVRGRQSHLASFPNAS